MTEPTNEQLVAARYLQPVAVPPAVTRVAGCSCGGVTWHTLDCAIHDLDEAAARAAVDAANARIDDFAGALTAAGRSGESQARVAE